ncbi:MAG: hypothetical protein ACMUHX_00015 [bacterium]
MNMKYTYQELRKKIDQSRKDLAEIEKCLREGEGLEKDLDKNVFQIEDRLKRVEQKVEKLKELEDLREDLKKVKEFVVEKKKILEQPKHKLKMYLGAELDRRFGDKGWHIEGNFPELRLGLLTLEFLLSQDQVRIWYGPKIELLSRSKLVADDISNIAGKIYEDLENESFKDGEAFLKLIFDVYGWILKKEGLDFGANVSIIYLLSEIAWRKQDEKFFSDPRKEHFRSYSRTQLSYDLFRLKQRECEGYELRLGVASREQTKNKDDNLWIPRSLKGDGTHFAFVCFHKHI